MPSDGIPFDRRTVLKRIGASAVVGTGLVAASNTAAAEVQERNRLIDSYHGEDALRVAFARHGDALRAKLVEAGFATEDFDFESLAVELDAEVNGLEPTADDARAGVTAIEKDGTMTALATVSASTRTHELALFVQPERDEAYALVEPKSGGDRVLVSESDVSPVGCSYFRCTSNWCDSPCYQTQEQMDCDENCENCQVVGTSCACRGCSCDDRSYCTTECSYCS